MSKFNSDKEKNKQNFLLRKVFNFFLKLFSKNKSLSKKSKKKEDQNPNIYTIW